MEVYELKFELCGLVGLDPAAAGPLTLRQLDLMARGRKRHDWHRTLEVLALLANCHRDPKAVRTPYTAAAFADALGFWWMDFAAAERRTAKPAGPEEVALLRKLFPAKDS